MRGRGGRACAAALIAGLLGLAPSGPAGARPERIRPGHSYDSDETVTQGPVRDIGGERNYEEVYQRYRYAPDGTLEEWVVERPGEP